MLWFHTCMSRSEALFDPLADPDTPPIYTASDAFVNPIRVCRKQLNMTLAQFSEATGVHAQAIHLLENGCYYPVLPRVSSFLSENSIIDPHELQEAYSSFQFHQRSSFGRQYSFSHLNTVGDWNGTQSPFEAFRIQVVRIARTALAKGLCVQPAALFRLANNQVKELPALVQAALSEAGLSMDLVY